jgi:hypothetical protein
MHDPDLVEGTMTSEGPAGLRRSLKVRLLLSTGFLALLFAATPTSIDFVRLSVVTPAAHARGADSGDHGGKGDPGDHGGKGNPSGDPGDPTGGKGNPGDSTGSKDDQGGGANPGNHGGGKSTKGAR